MNLHSNLNFFLVITLLTIASPSKPMEKEGNLFSSNSSIVPIIIQPYTPSFEVKHPTITHISTALGLGVLGSFATKNISSYFFENNNISKSALGAIGISIALSTYVYKKLTFNPSFFDTIITHPQKIALAYNNCSQYYYKSTNSILEKTTLAKAEDHFIGLIQQQISNNRYLTQQGECIEEGWGACRLSRTYNPALRATFEGHISNEILKIAQGKKDSINVVGFASGGGFGELRILVETLRQNPQAKINLAIIDPRYSEYTSIRRIIGLTPTVNPDENLKLNNVLKNVHKTTDELINDIKLQLTEDQLKGIDDKKIKESITLEWLHNQIKHLELINWIKLSFPEASFSFQVFGSHGEYIYYLINHTSAYPDIIEGADFLDEMSLMNNSHIDYRTLVTYALIKTKGKCFNLCLNKDENAYLQSISLKDNIILNSNNFIDMLTKSCLKRFSNEHQKDKIPALSKKDFIELLKDLIQTQQTVL